MRTSGQRPKPTALKIAEGDRAGKGKRKLQEQLEAEPKHQRGLGACPANLHGRARMAWKVLSEELSIAGMDRRPDAFMLESACLAWARACEAEDIYKNEGLVVRRKIRDPKTGELHEKISPHPAVGIAEKARAQLRAFLTEFGFSPGSRTRISTEKPIPSFDDDIELQRILSQPRKSIFDGEIQ